MLVNFLPGTTTARPRFATSDRDVGGEVFGMNIIYVTIISAKWRLCQSLLDNFKVANLILVLDKIRNGFIILSMNVKRYFRQQQQKKRKGRSFATELENLQILCAWHVGKLDDIQAGILLEVNTSDDIANLWIVAIEAGIRLAQE